MTEQQLAIFRLLTETQTPQVMEGVCLGILLFGNPDPETRLKLLSTGAYLTASRRMSEDSAFKTAQQLLQISPEEQAQLVQNVRNIFANEAQKNG